MAKDYVGPVTPVREHPAITVTPSAPRPIRRTETPVEGLFQARRVLRFRDPSIQPLSPEEANAFGAATIAQHRPLERMLTPVPEDGSEEDVSMTQETFGVDDARDARVVLALNSSPHNQQTPPPSRIARGAQRRRIRRQ